MNLPDVIGFALDEALAKIRESGLSAPNVLVAAPPSRPIPIGIPRVVRISMANELLLEVVVAYQDYGKEV